MGDHTFKVSNGAHNRGLALLGLVLLLGGALANDVVLEFLALDCHSRPVPGVTITLEGCVYRQDNDGKPFVVITDANGMAGLYRSPMVVQYCFGSASHLCSWSATKGGDTYVADITTLVNQTGAPTPITPHAFAGCKCAGCKCDGCKCAGCKCDGCKCDGCKCAGCKCDGCKCDGCKCAGCKCDGCKCAGCKCDGCKCAGCKCAGCKCAGCKCDGSDECEPVVHYPLIVLKRSGCPCPSSAPNHPHNKNNDGDDDDDDEPRPLSIQPLLPPRLCPTTCSIDLTDGSTRTGACYSSLPAAAGSRRLLADADVCPQGTLNTRQPCGGSAEQCGVCCVPYHIDYHHTQP
uniref:Uncharacterized protein n=1 Tax=Tetradesmus obliquus TaxID=3088 RepID=A0A383W0C7_TETOB|eukprot:jgi/Sobl393_1/950/SZX70599.1